MNSEMNGAPDREDYLDEVVIAYLEAVEAGQNADREQWLERHPDVADELRLFFADQDKVKRWTAPLRTVAEANDDTPVPGRPMSGGAPPGLGDYELLEEIARGGMGVVYRARQKSLNRLVAIKVVPERGLPAEGRRFRNEAEMVAGLYHPGIVPIHEVGDGQLYFSMKLIEGGTLAEHVDRYRASPEQAARLMVAVARAVHHAHQRGILHRDLKPSNILLDADGQPHVTDFGLAKRVDTDSGLTQSGMLVGTPSYMAPEQASGRRQALTTATDVHGLGAVLYVLLAGRPPFQGQTVLETLEQVKQQEPEWPSRHNPQVDRELEAVCLKCLDKEPARRYASAEALADDLERWLRREPVEARRAGRAERLWRWVRRHRVGVAGAACLLVALTALAGSVGWVLGDRAARQREAEGKVVEALEAAKPGLQMGNPWDPGLITAAQRAEAQLTGGMVGPHLRQRVAQLHKDVAMLAEMERIRLDRAEVRDGGFDTARSGPQYARAFREYGIDVEVLWPEEAVALMQGSAICEHLVAGLDDWAAVLPNVGPERAQKAKLLGVARQTGSGPWRDRLREVVRSGDRRELEKLARSAPVEELPTAALGLLGQRVAHRGGASGPIVDLLRRAQRRFPADFWINHDLAFRLCHAQPPQLEEAIGFYRVAVALRPQSPGVHLNLGAALSAKGDVDGAIAAYREAIRLKKDYAGAHNNLGAALSAKGDVDGAIAEFREAIRLKKDYAGAYNNLGVALRAKGDVGEAIAAYRKAIELKKDFAGAHFNLGVALRAKGDVDGAIAEFRKAIELKKDYPQAHSHLGGALYAKGDVDGAIAQFRKAIELKKDYASAHYNLGHVLATKGDGDGAIAAYSQAIRIKKDFAQGHYNLGIALRRKGDVAGAIVAYREAIRLKKDFPEAHNNLGNALRAKGDVDRAITEFRKAIELKKDFPEAHNNLGHALRDKGQFAEALTQFRRGHQIGAKSSRRPSPSARWLKECERLVELDAKLLKVLRGEAQPADAAERIALAHLCMVYNKRYAAAARFYAAAFSAQPALAADLGAGHRYDAACAAALSGCGQGKDAASVGEQERARLRQEALDWLRADLGAWNKLLDKGGNKAHSDVLKQMRHWQEDTDFAHVRGPEALARLPEAERPAWQKLWADVAATLAAARPKAAPKKSDPKLSPPREKESPTKE